MQDAAIISTEHHYDADATDVLGFWLYILTDCVIFACLFATFIVLNVPGMSGSSLKEHINLTYVLIETFFLLGSNFTFCLAALALNRNRVDQTQWWLLVTFLLGASFVGMELYEFHSLALEGFRWDYSGQASSFFTLVGTHGLHVSFGLLWIAFMIIQLPVLKITHITKRRMTYLGLFWNFLDIVWIFLFSIVYLIGAL